MSKNKVFHNTLIIFLIGLFIRLLLMPFAMQADLLSMSFRAHLMTNYGLWGIRVGQLFSHYFYALNLTLMKVVAHLSAVFPTDFSQIFTNPSVYGVAPGSITSSVGNWLNFIEHPQINAFIFFLKIPHLLADIAVFWILVKIFRNNKKKNLVLALWFFNPVNIYAFYIFSRHDAFTALALLLSIFFLAKEKIMGSIISIFTAIQVRFQPLFYLPIFIVHWAKNFHNKKKNVYKYIFGVLFILLIVFMQKNLPFNQELYDQIRNIESLKAVATSNNSNVIQKIFSLATSVGGKTTSSKLMLFIFIYAAINLFYLFVKKAKGFHEAFFNLAAISYLAMALYFVFNDFSPHYFVWLSLFATICSTLNKKFIYFYLLSILGWGLMGLMHTGNFAINQNLFLPVSPLLFNTPQIGYSLAISPKLFILGRVILNIGLLLSCYQLLVYFIPKLDEKLTLQKIFIPFLLLSLANLKPINQIQAAKYPVWESENESELILLKEEETYQFSFISAVDEFSAIDLKFDTSRDQAFQELDFCLKRDRDEQCLVENSYNAGDFYNRAFYPFGFKPITEAKNQQFTIELTLREDGNLRQLPLYLIEGDYALSTEKSTKELLPLIFNDLKNKYETQQFFFHFWFALLALNLLAIVSLLFSKKAKD